ncbi:hypothetical protein EH183_40025 [Streptomyces sp. CB01881]|uniref:hypothetical protein n=1 Tax=Streptomyces sp. CB01881 TaxID=2078691 RepID=UPI0011E05CD1|nr:hypothetical protein [Streptomyces sp. CB01881]TYC68478.1 hypothetical protein EH183_40025 [Streptomyces sp. CB01881]
MGIELALYDRRPPGHRKRPAVELHLSLGHGDALAAALAAHAHPTGHRLGRVDPYGDTLFNEQDAAAALAETAALLDRCATEAQRAAVRDLAEVLATCAGTPGSWLCFLGD